MLSLLIPGLNLSLFTFIVIIHCLFLFHGPIPQKQAIDLFYILIVFPQFKYSQDLTE